MCSTDPRNGNMGTAREPRCWKRQVIVSNTSSRLLACLSLVAVAVAVEMAKAKAKAKAAGKLGHLCVWLLVAGWTFGENKGCRVWRQYMRLQTWAQSVLSIDKYSKHGGDKILSHRVG